MNIFLYLGLLIVLYAFIDYKKAFMLFLLYRIFLNQNINIINLPGIPLLTLETALCVFFFLGYFVNKSKIKIEKQKFPLLLPFAILCFSSLISSIFGIAGINNTLANWLKSVFEDYVSIWLLWVIITDKADFVFLIKGILIVFFIAGIYGIYEIITHTNPIADFEISIAGGGDKVLDWNYDKESIRGYRIKSIFLHAIGAGMNYGMFLLMVFYLFYYHHKELIKRYSFYFIVSIISVICLLFTNSRGPVLFLIIGFIPFMNLAKGRNLIIFLISAVGIFFVFSTQASLFDNMFSIFNSTAQDRVQGSNMNMRFDQLETGMKIILGNPILGIGLKGTEYYGDKMLIKQLLGLESIWIWIIVQQGMVGVICYLYLIYSLVVKIGIKLKNKPVLFLSLGYFVTYSMTSVPGFITALFYFMIILLIKIEYLSENNYAK